MARISSKTAARTQPPNNAVRQSAEALASTLPPLLVAAVRVASTVAQGVHGRRRVGVGETFWQFRQYMPGDTANRIDWRQSAKSQRVYIRETEWEAAQSVWLWRDNSPSMHYRSPGTAQTKAARATLLLLATAALLVRGGEHIALLGRERVARSGRGALDRMTMSLIADGDQPAAHDGATGLPGPARLPRYSHLVLLSDFLTPFDEIEALVRRHAAQGVVGHLVHILDPAEEDLPFSGRTRFEGMEQEGVITVGRAEALRKDYQARLAALRAGLTDLAHSVGWTFTGHRTDLPPQPALLSLYGAFARGTV
ncbi:MAG: DUF58 domain-containing protein [Proteobacteria bacterium]|nr:DUF58 domain-containing protein [Pseudomonadota bacterium]